QERRTLMFNLVELDRELPDLLGPLPIGLENAARVLLLPLRTGDFVARRVLVAFQPFQLRNQPTPAVLQRGKRLELAVQIQSALLEAAAYLVLMVANKSRIQHGEIL